MDRNILHTSVGGIGCAGSPGGGGVTASRDEELSEVTCEDCCSFEAKMNAVSSQDTVGGQIVETVV